MFFVIWYITFFSRGILLSVGDNRENTQKKRSLHIRPHRSSVWGNCSRRYHGLVQIRKAWKSAPGGKRAGSGPRMTLLVEFMLASRSETSRSHFNVRVCNFQSAKVYLSSNQANSQVYLFTSVFQLYWDIIEKYNCRYVACIIVIGVGACWERVPPDI